MKFNVSSTALQSSLQPIGKVIATKNVLPILDCFLFSLNGNTLTVTASDSETRLVTTLDVIDGEGASSIAVPAKVLLDLLKELPEQPITFDINDSTFEIVIYFKNGKYNFVGQDATLYPQGSHVDGEVGSVSIGAQPLLGGIGSSLFAAGDDELRPVMSGVYFDIQADSLTFVASDGMKLVRLRNMGVKSLVPFSFILPKKPANILRNMLSRETGEVTIKSDGKNVYVSYHGFEMVCRLIEGRYPNYNSVIPQDNQLSVTVNRAILLNALKRVSVFSNPNNSLVCLNFKGGIINVFAQDIDLSTSAEERVECLYEGTELSIGFKATALIEILGNISSDDVIMKLSDPSHAGVILPSKNDENVDLLMLLMPMMLKD